MIKNHDHPSVQAIALQEEWQMYRHQDSLRWSKIQTVAGIEAFMVAGTFGAPETISPGWKFMFALIVGLSVTLICLLAEKDGRDADYHLQRAEAMLPLAETLGIQKPAPVLGMRGKIILRLITILVLLLNTGFILNVSLPLIKW